jgi:predicted DsbA family dithiol-disulfide isomerase
MAMESDLISADMVEVTEFPFLAQKYNIFGVPKTVVNESVQFEGAVPEAIFLEKVLQAAEMKPEGEKK